MNKVAARDKVHKELVEYHRLKKRWGLRHIKIKLSPCALEHCKARLERVLHENRRDKHTDIIGYYLDEDNVSRRTFLGYTLEEAHARLEYVKRFYP